MSNYYYAIFDTTVSKSNPGHGFCNTKKAICFTSFNKMINFIENRHRYDFSCKRINRKEAMKMLESYYDTRSKGLFVDDPEDFNMKIFRKSIFDF